MVEEDTWKGLKKLENMMDLVKEFEKKIREEKMKRVQMRIKKGKKNALNPEAEMFERNELLGKYTAKILFRWNDGKFEDEYLKKLEKSWARWKEKGRQVPLEVEP